MTIDEFMVELEKTRYTLTWRDNDGCIRGTWWDLVPRDCCPITAVATLLQDRIFDPSDAEAIGRDELSMDEIDAKRVVRAADAEEDLWRGPAFRDVNLELRARIKKAVGLA